MNSEDDRDEEVDESVESDSFMMPVVPENLRIDPLLAALLHCAAFLDFSDDDAVDPQAAGDVLEHVGMYVQRLPAERFDEIQEQLDRLEDHAQNAGWPEDMIEFVRDFLYNCGIGDEEEETDDGDDEEEGAD